MKKHPQVIKVSDAQRARTEVVQAKLADDPKVAWNVPDVRAVEKLALEMGIAALEKEYAPKEEPPA